jgi:gamma-glutamylcyclotransferase (GGCT)/AIG2-like uncharacterized protein YtfP
MGNAIIMEEKLPTLDELNSSTTSEETLPTLDELNGVAKKKYAHITIEFGRWYFRINGKRLRIRSPFTWED